MRKVSGTGTIEERLRRLERVVNYTEVILPATMGAGDDPIAGGGGTVTSISAGNGITLTPNPIIATGTVAVTTQALLNTTLFTDVVAAGPTRGDVIVANSTPKWARLALGGSGNYLRSNGTDAVWATIPAGDLPGSFSGFANPTALVGLTAVNGAATTAMRSDAAPPIDQTIAPAWTGTHTWGEGNVSGLEMVVLTGLFPVAAGTQDSPKIRWRGTSKDGGNHRAEWREFVHPTANAGTPSQLIWEQSLDGGAFATQMALTDGGVVSPTTGFQINLATATAGHYLRGNGTNYVDGVIAAADVPDLSATYALAARNINTTAPLTGGGNLTADRTLAVSDFVASGASHARGTVPDPGAVAGTTRFLREDATWVVSPPVTTGTAIVDFGAFPGGSSATVLVTGQTALLAGSNVQAWIARITTVDHSPDEHSQETLRAFAGDIVPGVGFVISMRNDSQLNEPSGIATQVYGKWTCGWMWQ